MKATGLWKTVVVIAIFCLAASVISSAQTFTTLLSFDKTDYLPGDLVQGRNGGFYSISGFGGTNAEGSVIEISDQNVSTLYNFCALTNCTDGAYPQVGVLLGTDGNFYGTTFEGGHSTCKGCGSGTVFRVTPSGKLTTLYAFCSQAKCAHGYDPEAKLTQASNGTFFGTTFYGGTNPGPYNVGYGTLFEITSSGKFTSLYSFCSQTNCTDGSHPHWAPIQATNGNIYGTTYWGGANNSGTVFSLSHSGQLATMYSFTQPSGSTFTSGPLILMQASDGNLYGTTNYGGTNAQGTILKITTSGVFTNLYNILLSAQLCGRHGTNVVDRRSRQKFLWHDVWWRNRTGGLRRRCLWHDLQTHSQRDVDDSLRLLHSDDLSGWHWTARLIAFYRRNSLRHDAKRRNDW